jgi:hypothetical protein
VDELWFVMPFEPEPGGGAHPIEAIDPALDADAFIGYQCGGHPERLRR